MVLYGMKFDICNEESLDLENVICIPEEGTIIPFNIGNIEGLAEQLYQCGFSDARRVIKSFYGFFLEEYRELSLCIKYTNGRIRFVPIAGYHIEANEIQFLINAKSCNRNAS